MDSAEQKKEEEKAEKHRNQSRKERQKMMMLLLFLASLLQITNSFTTSRHHPFRVRIANSISMSTVVGAELTNARSFLQTLLSSKSKMEDKASLVSALQGLRAKESDGSVNRVEEKSKPAVWNGDKAAFLDAILQEIDSVRGIFGWPNAQFLSFLPSYRVKVVALKRMMSLITAEEVEQIAAAKVLLKEDNVEQALAALKQTRQRRALSVIFGQLQSQPQGIRGLEKEAKSRILQQTTMAEMLDRTPKGLETPSYDVVYQNPAQTWEVRQYNDFSVVSMVMDGTQSQGPGGFNSLAGYIFVSFSTPTSFSRYPSSPPYHLLIFLFLTSYIIIIIIIIWLSRAKMRHPKRWQ